MKLSFLVTLTCLSFSFSLIGAPILKRTNNGHSLTAEEASAINRRRANDEPISNAEIEEENESADFLRSSSLKDAAMGSEQPYIETLTSQYDHLSEQERRVMGAKLQLERVNNQFEKNRYAELSEHELLESKKADTVITDDAAVTSPKGMAYYQASKCALEKAMEIYQGKNIPLELPQGALLKAGDKLRQVADKMMVAAENQIAHDRQMKYGDPLIDSPITYAERNSFYQSIADYQVQSAKALHSAVVESLTANNINVIDNFKNEAALFKNAALCKSYAGFLGREVQPDYAVANDVAAFYVQAGDCARAAAESFGKPADLSVATYWVNAQEYFKQTAAAISQISDKSDAARENEEVLVNLCGKQAFTCESIAKIYRSLAQRKVQPCDEINVKIMLLLNSLQSIKKAIIVTRHESEWKSLKRYNPLCNSYDDPCFLEEATAYHEEQEDRPFSNEF